MRAQDRLRWQIKTREQLTTELSRRNISLNVANEIISHPKSYGLSENAVRDPHYLLRRKAWKNRAVAYRGWEILSVLLGIIGAICILMIIGSVVYIIYDYRNFIKSVIISIGIIGVIVLLLWALVISIGGSIFNVIRQMIKYH
jgi:hypothetical protein